jgi:carboxymethylenebutenolidase
MCNEHTLRVEADARRALALSRRDFNILALSAAAVALLPGAMVAADVKESMVDIKTADGVADCYFVHPAKGRHPGVLMWPDFMGLRPAYKMLAKQLAKSGYSVLVINTYYRGAKSPIMEKADFDDSAAMEKISEQVKQLNAEKVDLDAKACIAFLDDQSSVDKKKKIGTLGYCMTGAFAFRTAAVAADRVGAMASFHGGGLVSDRPTSPHLLIPGIKARALIAIAENDDEREPETRSALSNAFAKADLPAEVEVYPGTQHGWCTPDMSAYYNETQAQRAWGRLLAMFEKALV